MLVNITIPVFNEEMRLPVCVPKLLGHINQCRGFDFELIIADNGSTDRTLEIAREFNFAHQRARVVCLDQKGRGRAIKRAWTESEADILSYMDVDLSTDLECFVPLIESLSGGVFDLATGSRLLKTSRTTRRLGRELISRCYNMLVKSMFHTQFSDAQCGFKAITRRAAKELLPRVEDNGWFMDTELLIRAEKLNYRIFDLPVQWVDNVDSRVKIIRTAAEDLKGLIRLKRELSGREYGTSCGPRVPDRLPSRSQSSVNADKLPFRRP